MKYKFIFFIVFLILLSCKHNFSGNDKREKALFENIKIGMVKEEVVRILGEPDYINIDSLSNGDFYFFYFTKNKGVLRSVEPYVLFDSSGVVKFSTYGDGG